MSSAFEDVRAEWQKQLLRYPDRVTNGWTQGELARAAACHASPVRCFQVTEVIGRTGEAQVTYVDLWPWEARHWGRQDRRQELVRAAALIIAEIDRLDRAAEWDAAARKLGGMVDINGEPYGG